MLLWIVGKNGLLASSFRRLLIEKKRAFIATSKEEVDITDRAEVAAFLGTNPITHIINCSGYTAVDRAEVEEEKAFVLNVIGPANLASFHLPIVHFSSDYVFDGEKSGPYSEEQRANPRNVYGQTKREGEKGVLKNPEALVLRISWLFGKEGTHFVSSMQRLMQEKASLQIVADQKGRPTFADDVVEVTLKLIEKKAKGIYHFANEGEVTWYDFAKQIKACTGGNCELSPITTEAYGAPAYRPKNSVLSTDKIEKLLGEKPPVWQNRLPEVLS